MDIDTHWQRVTALFGELLDEPDDERERVLLSRAEGDALLVSEVRTLLRAHSAADGRFDKPVLTRLSRAEMEAIAPPDLLLAAGRVGAYNVIRKIGEGGMGAVYEATRGDAAYEQRVAIKTIARGAGSTVIATRFRRERQILAGLQHSNIAVMLDGGVTETGTPYFVMEYVDGLPIDQWCRTKSLSITQRLDLMQQVCRGVQHAHQRLIVHRDLKPQNVFVSVDGIVKLLDFGIAKLIETGNDGYELSTVTRDGPTPMTAAYASPEQLRGEPVSTAGDVYSLGVMLYELLADVPPFPAAGRTAAQLANAVLTITPPSPSAACTDEAARACGEGDRVRLAKRLSGELDAIVMMAMRKEPERRYSSVEALAADIQRYLRGLPVAARPDTLTYRVQRFAKRNRWPVAMAAMLVAVALLSSVVIVRQSVIARREAARTARISEFLQAVLGAADTRSVGGLLPRIGPGATVGVLLDSALRHVSTEFSDDPAVRARLYLTIAQSRIAQSRMRDASEILDSAITLARATYGERSDLYVIANLEAGAASLHRNHLPQARAYAFAAQAALTARGQTTGELYGRALADLASAAQVSNDYADMQRYANQALALESRRTPLPTMAKVVAQNRLATWTLLQGDFRRADSLYTKALAMLDTIAPSSNLERFDIQYNRQAIAMAFGRLAQADSIISEGERLSIVIFGPDSREHALFLAARADYALTQGDTALARRVSDDAVRIVDSIPEVVTPVRLIAKQAAISVAVRAAQWERADSITRDALRIMKGETKGGPLVLVLTTHGIVLTRLARLAEADSQLARAEQTYARSGIKLDFMMATIHSARADLYDRKGDVAGVAREIAKLPAVNVAGVRDYIRQQRTADSIRAARLPKQ